MHKKININMASFAAVSTLGISLMTVTSPDILASNERDHSQHMTAMKKMDHADHSQHKAPDTVSRIEVSYSIPKISMLNQNAERVFLSDLFNTDLPVMVNFIFTTCPTICPVMSATFSDVQNLLGVDSSKIRMISISIDPEQDRPAALTDYAKRFRAGPQWEFLTGSMDESITVQKAFDTDRGDKMNHAPATFLRTSRNDNWIRYDGFATAHDLVKELRKIL